MKIIIIRCVLHAEKFETRTKEVEVVEKPNSFVSEELFRRYKKSEIGIIKPMLKETHCCFQFYLFCLLEEVENEQKRLEAFVLEKFKKVQSEVNNLAIQVSLYKVKQW